MSKKSNQTVMRQSIRFLSLSFLLCAATLLLNAQEKKSILGSVQDSSGRGLPDVSVTVKGSKSGSITDAQGIFKISVPATGNPVLVFSSIGFLPREVAVDNRGNITVVMQGKDNALNEVVVTGFGARKGTRKLSYSVTEVKGSDLVKANNANFVDALQGKVAGVYIAQGSGGPSSSAQIRIRGNSSL